MEKTGQYVDRLGLIQAQIAELQLREKSLKESLVDEGVGTYEGRFFRVTVSTIYLLHPVSVNGRDWIEEHIPGDAQMLGNAVAVEHRYIGDIVVGATADGLVVS